LSIVSGWAGFVKPCPVPAWKPLLAALKSPATSPATSPERKYFRDREHLRGLPVSKIIGDAGHSVWNPVSDSRALRGSIGFSAALFQPLERVAATETGLFPVHIWQKPNLLLMR
jgi:hypothetical protein